MKLNKIFSAAALASVLALTTGCAEDYTGLNQDPANVTVTDPKALMSQAVLKFQPNDYLLWYYNVNYFTRWSQMATPTGSYTDEFTEMAESGGQGGQYIEVLKYRNQIQNYIENTGDETQRGYEAACTVMAVYLGMFDSDMYGALPYTQACHYADQGILTPEYDTVETLYNTFLSELDQAITYFQAPTSESNSTLDVVYGGDWAKWAKLANSLKLKVAVRLYNNDSAKALQIAEAVAKSPAGYIDSADDDMLFCKATAAANSGDNDYVYGTGNGLASPGLSLNVEKYMKNAKDPRIRFIYRKNSLNSTVIQALIDGGKFDNLPAEVKADVVLDENGNFKEWGGMGEPWVRYHGYPVVLNGSIKEEYKAYFNYGTDYQITVDEATKSYSPFSTQQEEMKRGRCGFSVPTVGPVVIQDTDNNPLWTMYMTSAEVNLYLAEFKLLGANLPNTAEAYYNKGVRASVENYNKLAKENKIPYYGNTYNYDPNEAVIDLQAGEIDAMMATETIKLTGTTSEQLEKVYLQQLMHFTLQVDDQFVTARRSGYPKIGSNLLPYVQFDGIALNAIPRRFEIAKPNVTDVMYDIKNAAYAAQGFNTLGTGNSGSAFNLSGTALNTERLWQDKNAPQWGSPK